MDNDSLSLYLLEVGPPIFTYVGLPSDMPGVVTTLVYKVCELLFRRFFLSPYSLACIDWMHIVKLVLL